MYAPARLLLPHFESVGVVVYEVRRSRRGTLGVNRGESIPGRGEIVGVEVNEPGSLAPVLDEIGRHCRTESARDWYFHVSGRGQLSQVLGGIRRWQLGEPQVFGIDPDYYFSVVPMSGPGNAAVQRYVAGLKIKLSARDRILWLLKRLLIRLGRSHHLYGRFLVVVPRRQPSAADLQGLLEPC